MVKEITYTERDGATPIDALNFLNWTQRDGATFDGPFKYDKPRTGGYPHSQQGGSGFTGYWMSELGEEIFGTSEAGFVTHQWGVYIGADGTYDMFEEMQGWMGRFSGHTISGTTVGNKVTVNWIGEEGPTLSISGTIVGDTLTGEFITNRGLSLPIVFKKTELEPAPIITFDDNGQATLTPAPGATYTEMAVKSGSYFVPYEGPFLPSRNDVLAVGVKIGIFQEQEDAYMVSDYAMAPVPGRE